MHEVCNISYVVGGNFLEKESELRKLVGSYKGKVIHSTMTNGEIVLTTEFPTKDLLDNFGEDCKVKLPWAKFEENEYA